MEGRNIVVCCDGTSNEIGSRLSNVLKLYRIAAKDERQIVYYSPGIGTVSSPHTWGRWRARARAGFEMATGWGLDRDVLAAYSFLCREYRDGDRIYLFGFSRGAYTVRVVAGMMYLIGLLRPHQINFAGYALKAYKVAGTPDGSAAAHEFAAIVLPRIAAVHLLGVWDTVASVIVPGATPGSEPRLEELPHTSDNPVVRAMRHAIAIDERRRMFRPQRWTEGQPFQPNRHSQAKEVNKQDCRQVWFAGCHADIGGGFEEAESALSKYPLLWMLEEAGAQGLIVRTQMVNHIVRGIPLPNARAYIEPRTDAPMHPSLTSAWKLLEMFPKPVSLRDWHARPSVFGHYIPWGEPRTIPDGSLLHASVIERRELLPQLYRPINMPGRYAVEPMPSAPTPPGRRESHDQQGV